MCGHLTPLTRDFHRLLKNVKQLSNNQAKVVDYKDDICEFILEIKPSDGYYSRGTFEFKIEPKSYPQCAPKVESLTDIYHPNISNDYEREVCLSLFDDWTSQNDLEDCVQGLLFLLYNPNLEDPLNPYFDPGSQEQIDRFAQDVRDSLEGGMVEDYYYERNIDEAKDESVVDENNESGELDKTTVVTDEGTQTTLSSTEVDTKITTQTPQPSTIATASTTQMIATNEMIENVATATTPSSTEFDTNTTAQTPLESTIATAATTASTTTQMITTNEMIERVMTSTTTPSSTEVDTNDTTTTASTQMISTAANEIIEKVTTLATTTQMAHTTYCVEAGLLFLLCNINIEDLLNPYFDPEIQGQICNFADDVRTALAGKVETMTAAQRTETGPTTEMIATQTAVTATTAVATATITPPIVTTSTTKTRGQETTQTIQTTPLKTTTITTPASKTTEQEAMPLKTTTAGTTVAIVTSTTETKIQETTQC